ncbi:hypothetical protein ACFFX1_26900 [Dactylosporangium sucinum]|uniref:Aminoglycoside phosphotransferase domain-containing protein n=1 Tax=Dactylosporangium sucinum TaxID=1424081 RepID=A0A917T022_9ACTN|nr:hypothetical protein [Dactylosporangium sucinum]GGM06008.1 hypothetical protein GCM10007977_003980 [Dactylosporangium sucinum]
MTDLDAWCARWLGSPVAQTSNIAEHLSSVHAVRLADGRRVVVKIRPAEARLAGCFAVHKHLWRAGFPCPEPLTGPHPFTPGRVASAETAITPAAAAPLPPAAAFATLLHELVRLAPPVAAVPSLRPSPAWARWHHDEGRVWPPPDDRDADLNEHPDPSWLDEVGTRVRRRLTAVVAALHPIVGHCDFESHNIWWHGSAPLAVHDWDSAVAEPEPVVVGLAAAMWPAGATAHAATVQQTADFLDAYQAAGGRRWSADELAAAWAAGLWIRAFNAKKASLDGLDRLDRDEAEERGRRAGI